jgi:uncharacterized protein YbjT (DUF2867 family)
MSAGGRRRVAIAGASGFIGRALLARLAPAHDVIALARRVEGQPASPGVEWRACDLFNLLGAEHALEGADVAVYLVHSMMPSARLTQGRFDDLDLICADNFARAAASNGVRHIVYLGGLLPASGEALSRHLESRFEVERTLGAHGVPVTTLRAGLIIGPGGSSFDMMARLVGRLPFMIGPRWTRSLTQPIALDDAITLLDFAVGRPDLAGRAYDVGGPDVVSYAEMLRLTGAAQGKRTRVVTLPVRTARLSLWWVSAITGASPALVLPLVESLRHDMVASDGLVLQKEAGLDACPLRVALERASREGAPRGRAGPSAPTPAPAAPRACSVQRLRVRPGKSAAQVAEEYVAWLPRFLRSLLRVSVGPANRCEFYLGPLREPLLVLQLAPGRSSPDRQLFYVEGGLLCGEAAGARPRLEFRSVLDGAYVLAAVHDFVPRLPWLLYKYTHALVHLWVMRAFSRHLAAEGPALCSARPYERPRADAGRGGRAPRAGVGPTSIDDSVAMGVADDLGDRARAELGLDLLQVAADRARGEVELGRDVAHGAPVNDQREDLVFARRQPLVGGPLAAVGLAHGLLGDGLGEVRPAARGPADGEEELFAGAIFAEVRGGARAQHGQGVLLFGVHREHDHGLLGP